jgi:hypothetical protein
MQLRCLIRHRRRIAIFSWPEPYVCTVCVITHPVLADVIIFAVVSWYQMYIEYVVTHLVPANFIIFTVVGWY